MERYRIVIVGAGPAGLACATRLHQRGIRGIVVLEREQEAGGVPRHCGHWGFGWESHRRLMSGPDYAARLREEAKAIDLRTGTTVLEFISPYMMRVQTPKGIMEIETDHVILATGARESTRAARFIGGARLPQVINTGTLQQLVYFKNMKPFARPVILGGEWVSFSALMTSAHAGIKPAAMIVEDARIDAPWFFSLGARFRYGVPVHTATRLVAIEGIKKVESVEVEHKGQRRHIACDGVIVSGEFVPEDALFAAGPLGAIRIRERANFVVDPHILPHVQLTGNVTGPLKTAGRCVAEAHALADALSGA